VLVTSPAAVRAACALQPLRRRRGQSWFAVGAGTAAALRRAGIDDVAAPARMDSEGLLALPGLRSVRGSTIGLVTAPGGRGRIVPALQRRGARVLRADVYERMPIAPSPRAVAALRALAAPAWLLLSSGEALAHLLDTLPDDAIAALRRARVAAASDRLARLAAESGFAGIVTAASARPRDLLDAAAQATATSRKRR
jgi:uroporphyrinogen-III synthase